MELQMQTLVNKTDQLITYLRRHSWLLFSIFNFQFSILLLTSCDFTRTGMAPAYLTIDSIVPADSAGNLQRGFPGRAFPDVNVFVDGNAVGTMDLTRQGALIPLPIPFDGKHYVTVTAVVRVNGQSSKRVGYPFYREDSILIDFKPEGVYSLGRVVVREYGKSIARPIVEDFEHPAPFQMDSGPLSNFPMARLQGPIPNGYGDDPTFLKPDYYGYVEAKAGSPANSLLEIAATASSALPQKSTDAVYAQFDYRSSIDFTFGLHYTQGGGVQAQTDPDGGYKASPGKWKRAFVFLGDVGYNVTTASGLPAGIPLRFFVLGLADTTINSFIAIDNVKLQYIKGQP